MLDFFSSYEMWLVDADTHRYQIIPNMTWASAMHTAFSVTHTIGHFLWASPFHPPHEDTPPYVSLSCGRQRRAAQIVHPAVLPPICDPTPPQGLPQLNTTNTYDALQQMAAASTLSHRLSLSQRMRTPPQHCHHCCATTLLYSTSWLPSPCHILLVDHEPPS